MIASGELFLLNSESCGELRVQPGFANKNIRVVAAKFDRAYVACEPAVPTPDERQTTVYCFTGDSSQPQPTKCPEFDAIEGDIRQIAIGEKHVLVLTQQGTVYSKGVAVYGSNGHGGARDVLEFEAVPALRNRNVKFVSAGPYFSIAITQEGDVYSWGQSFHGESGLFTQVDAVPRFAPAITPFRVTSVSCGNAHVLACTETLQCLSWGENTCGQLGLGQKSKPTFKPQLLDAIPSPVASVSAGWAHSVAVGTDGRVYTWGLNSHGQLGIGDTKTQFAPNLLHALVGACHIETAHASRVLTIFHTSDSKALLCGQVPASGMPDAEVFAPRRPGVQDPDGCLLCPVPLVVAGSSFGSLGSTPCELSHISAFDKGAVGFARSKVYKVAPNLAPITGKTTVEVFVTGLPYETPTRAKLARGVPLVQDNIPVKVRLKSTSPLCDVVVSGRIIAEDRVEFETPPIGLSPLGAVVEKGNTCAVQLQVSMDNGLTWTCGQQEPPSLEEFDRTARGTDRIVVTDRSKTTQGLRAFKDTFAANRRAAAAAASAQTVLWYCQLPAGPTELEPTCAPVAGGTNLLAHIALPPLPSTNSIMVKFICKPLHSIGDPELEAKAPMRRDGAEIRVPDREKLAQLPLVGELDVVTIGWLDPKGRGVCCVTPPFNAEHVRFYEYFVELSLDGRCFLDRSLPFDVFDLRVTGLEPNIGPLTEPTKLTIKTTGLVQSNIHVVRLDFPKQSQYQSRYLPADYDVNRHEITFDMPDLVNEVALDPDSGLAGLEVFVELSLNRDNYTEDGIRFTYHGTIAAGAMKLLAPPEGAVMEPVKEDPKTTKKRGSVVEDPVEMTWQVGSKIGCEVSGFLAGLDDTRKFCALRVEVVKRVGDDEQPFSVIDLPATVEVIAPTPAGTPDEDAAQPHDMATAILDVGIRKEHLPEDATLLLKNFQASLNGQFFVPCAESGVAKLELPASPPADG